MRKPWCTSNSFVCTLLNVLRIPKPAHLRRASILRSKILAEVGFTSTEHFNYPWVKPPAARETKKRAEWRVTSVFALRKPWCTSNSFVCALLNVPRIPKPAHLRRASILRSKILAEVGFTSTEHFNYPWVKPPAARETKKRAEWRVTSVFALRKPWCTSNSFVCALLNVPRIPKPAHLRRASILRSKILAEVGFTSTEHFNYPWVKPPAARETKKRAEWRVTSVFALRKPWCTSNSFVCALLNVLRIPKPAHLRRANILRSKILAEVGFISIEHFNYPWGERMK